MFSALRLAVAALLTAMAFVPAGAAVTMTFYSRELGTYFPHAFVLITGATDAAPDQPVAENYGFTAKNVTPALLMGPVPGIIKGGKPGYVRKSDPHLAVVLRDDQYHAVRAVVARWRDMPGRSYDLEKRNCVFFVGDIARAIGMRVEDPPGLMKRPRSYIINLIRLNPGIGTVVPGGRAERALERDRPGGNDPTPPDANGER